MSNKLILITMSQEINQLLRREIHLQITSKIIQKLRRKKNNGPQSPKIFLNKILDPSIKQQQLHLVVSHAQNINEISLRANLVQSHFNPVLEHRTLPMQGSLHVRERVGPLGPFSGILVQLQNETFIRTIQSGSVVNEVI